MYYKQHKEMGKINKYIFSHNFEPTRNTMYGGVAAQMINNRKFYAAEGNSIKGFNTRGNVEVIYDKEESCCKSNIVRINEGGALSTQNEFMFLESGKTILLTLYLRAKSKVVLQIELLRRHLNNSRLFQQYVEVQSNEWTKFEFEYTPVLTERKCILNMILIEGSAVEIAVISLLPKHNYFGMKYEVLEKLKEIKPAMIRYPGGCYAEFFNFKESLLPVDLRPPMVSTGLEFVMDQTYYYDTHEIGIDEFIKLCEYVNAEPSLTIRMSDYSLEESYDFVEYCNGDNNTKWGKIREDRGHKSYNVKVWFIGNEIKAFGRNGINNPVAYVEKYNSFAKKIKFEYKDLTLIISTNPTDNYGHDVWNKQVLQQKPLIDVYSHHNYILDTISYNKPETAQEIALAPYELLYKILKMGQADMNAEGYFCSVCLDEWNIQWSHWGTALSVIYCAGVLNMLIRESKDLNLHHAGFFTPFNEGGIRITEYGAKLDSSGIIFKYFVRHAGNKRI
jgi:alpha-N-arabinofuranosidase